MTETSSCRALLISLGGSPEPVIYSLNEQRPEYVLFFVSTETAPQIQDVVRELSYHVRDFDRILSPSAEDLETCYRVLRTELPEKLALWSVDEDDLGVDYTGGTKTMSAALVLATIERVQRYSYVGGVERDRGGVGVVIGGRERMLHVHNPWKVWAEEERKRIRLYVASARYQTALEELQRLVTHAEGDETGILQALASAVEGYRDWDNFRHKNARPKLGRALNFFKPYAQGRSDADLARFVRHLEANLDFLQKLTDKDSRDAAYVLDLVANAERRARLESKYEDAVARLYSALERGARFRLRSRHDILTDAVDPEQIPEALREEYQSRYVDTRDGQIKVPLLAAYRLLDALDDEFGRAFMARQDEVLELLSLRNLSPLGHGENPVDENGYMRFRALLMELLQLDEAALPRFPEPWV